MPISTNPGSTEAGEYGLTRGTCFVARRLEVVAVAGLLCIWWCVLGAAEFISCFFSRSDDVSPYLMVACVQVPVRNFPERLPTAWAYLSKL